MKAVFSTVLLAPLALAAYGADYFPPPESAGGWRTLNRAEDVRRIAGMDPAKLDALNRWLLESDKRNFAAVVVRRGYVVLEVDRGNSAKTDARRVASVSKAVCATVLAIAAEQSQHGLTPKTMRFDDPAIEALFRPIGVEHWTFEYFEGGGPDGHVRYGRHPSHSMGMPARDLARIAYCLLRGGRWQDRQVVPRWFVEETAAPTHSVKEPELRFQRAAESFSHGWELPARLTDGRGAGIPQDARFKPGSGGQLIALVPSLDLVIARQTGSSGSWDYEQYLRLVCQAVVKE